MDISMNILNNVNELYLFWNILDYIKESPIQCYKKVLEELKFTVKTRCNINCRFRAVFFDNELISVPVFMRATHANCTMMCGGSVSEYDHRFCGYCSAKGTSEYNYHHRICRGFVEERYPVTNPLDENDNFLNLL